MNKKIKVIDLLNKIANGETIPKKIKHGKVEYTLVNKMGYVSCKCLNDEVEILEDNTEEIEELPIYNNIATDERLKINELVKVVNEIRKDLNK